MAFRILKIILCLAIGITFIGAAMGQSRVGAWEFRIEAKGTANERKVAYTPAQSHSGSNAKPNLLLRRKKHDSPVELVVTSTHDKTQDKCSYKDWKIAIDNTEIPILAHTFEPAKTVLKAHLGAPKDELWDLFRNGAQLKVQAQQTCDSYSGKPVQLDMTFSLHGSSAAYAYIEGNPK